MGTFFALVCAASTSSMTGTGSAHTTPVKGQQKGEIEAVGSMDVVNNDDDDNEQEQGQGPGQGQGELMGLEAVDWEDEVIGDDIDGKPLSFVKLKLARSLFNTLINSKRAAPATTGSGTTGGGGGGGGGGKRCSSSSGSAGSNHTITVQSFAEAIQTLSQCYHLLLYDVYYCRTSWGS